MSNRMPIVRQASWLATIPQLVACAALVVAGFLITRSAAGVVLGSGIYLLYSIGLRKLLLRAHRRGIRLSREGRYAEAIEAYHESYAFLTRHWRIDEFRSVVLMSPSAISYREMALVNIAYCYTQSGDAIQAKEYYRRALDEFPDSGMARSALTMIETIEQSSLKSARD